MNFWSEITLFGDVTITSLAALVIAAWLLAENEKRLALLWGTLFVAAMALVVATKMAFIGWGIGIRAIDFAGFSGHTMRSAAVMPVLCYLLLEKSSRWWRVAAVGSGFAFAALIGASRLALHTHSVSEVVAGWLLGALVSAIFIRVASASLRKHVLNPLRVAMTIVALLAAPYVHPAPTQQWLTTITLLVTGNEHPFPRADWHNKPSEVPQNSSSDPL